MMAALEVELKPSHRRDASRCARGGQPVMTEIVTACAFRGPLCRIEIEGRRPRARRAWRSESRIDGTDATSVNLDLASPPGSGVGDSQADTVVVSGTNDADVVTAAGDASGVSVDGSCGCESISLERSPPTTG